jgi:glucose/arabinose dehydrogenase
MTPRAARFAALGAAASALVVAGSASAGGPPPPTSSNGHKVHLVASGLGTPTAFAFGAGTVFESDAGAGGPGAIAGVNSAQRRAKRAVSVPGGVYVLSKGKATRVPGSPPFSFGIVWRKGTLYVSAGSKLLAWSGWDGKTFKKHRTIYTAPKNFPGFNGLGFGANGRLYAGVDVGQTNDHGPATAPYQYDFLSFSPKGGKPTVVAKGIRQPWQMAFPAGSSSPYVSDLGQDSGAVNPPDFVLRIKQGQNYGFPKCNWTQAWRCNGYAKPFWFFSPHTDVMGEAIAGKRLYMSDFGAGPGGPQVNSMPLSGGKVKPLLTNFVAPIVGLGIHDKWLYVGELTGQVWKVKL